MMIMITVTTHLAKTQDLCGFEPGPLVSEQSSCLDAIQPFTRHVYKVPYIIALLSYQCAGVIINGASELRHASSINNSDLTLSVLSINNYLLSKWLII
jgi:hypothetical protein